MGQIKILAVAISLLLLSGCADKVTYLDNADSKEMTSAGIDFHDFEQTADKLLASLMKSGYIAGLQGQKRPKVLAISDVVNDTMQKLDTEQLTRKIVREVRNSGKFVLTAAIAGSGGSTDKMLGAARELRENDEFNQYSTQDKGQLVAPELSLYGKIVQKNTKVGSKQRIDYFFLLSLVDIKTGLVLWDDESNIIKAGSAKSSAW